MAEFHVEKMGLSWTKPLQVKETNVTIQNVEGGISEQFLTAGETRIDVQARPGEVV
jgi:hypothetical protein